MLMQMRNVSASANNLSDCEYVKPKQELTPRQAPLRQPYDLKVVAICDYAHPAVVFFCVPSAPVKSSHLAPQAIAINGDIDPFMTEYRVTANCL
jgi:hypothetical protein